MSPYTIVGGVPAKIIKYRFPQEQIEKLLALKIYDLDEKQVLKMREYLQTDDIDALTAHLKNYRANKNICKNFLLKNTNDYVLEFKS